MTIKTLDDLSPSIWGELSDAYGSASDTPRLLCMLTSTDQEERQEAVDDLLFSRAYHQFDMFTVTPHVIRFVVPLLEDASIANLPIHRGTILGDEIISFCRACSEGQAASPEVMNEVAKALSEGVAAFAKWTASERPQTALDATKLLQYVQCGNP